MEELIIDQIKRNKLENLDYELLLSQLTVLNNKPYNLADVVAELNNIVDVSLGQKPIKYSVKTIDSIAIQWKQGKLVLFHKN